jgi:WD40 repeat protein
MDTRQVVARFEAERQALALMDHPNIAKVLDGGQTGSGRPYFVMDLVKGVPITDYCDQARLTPRERLELFVHVCQAVQHAHQKGIIHRDLKPSNVLVTLQDGSPLVKVIDFGIAKALGQELTDQTLFTGFAQLLGTPLYMSPEQAALSNVDVDTRSDVYSLGVLLYELLTGTTPFDGERLRTAGFDELRRILREEEPAKPSTRLSTLGQAAVTVAANRHSDPRRLSQLCRGELDWIVMKALEKDRSRRYESASAFAADVQRYLRDEPVEACPPSAWYHLRKFARRHRAVVGTTLAVTAAVVALAVGSVLLWQAKEDLNRANADLTRSLQRERQNAYYERIALADREGSANNPGRVEELLEQCLSDLRGWEWYYLKRLRSKPLPPLRHDGAVLCAVFSPDGRRIASCDQEGWVKVWDADNGQELLRFLAHKNHVRRVTVSPDGQVLATASWDGTAKLWHAQTGHLLRTLTGRPGVCSGVAFSPDGRCLASGHGHPTEFGEVKVWDTTTGQALLTLSGHGRPVIHVAFSPDGQRLAASSADTTVSIWDVRTGRKQLTFHGHTGAVSNVAFSPDGQYLASTAIRRPGTDMEVKVWDGKTGRELFSLRGRSYAAFSPDGRRLALGSPEGTVKLWDPKTAQEAVALRGHFGAVRSVAFSPDGHRLVTASNDRTVHVWDARPLDSEPDAGCLTLRGHAVEVHAVAFHPRDGHLLASAGADGSVRLWDAQRGKALRTLSANADEVFGLAFHPDGRQLAATGNGTQRVAPGKFNGVTVWDTTTWQELPPPVAVQGVRSVAFSPDGRLLAVGRFVKTPLTIRDTASGKVVHELPNDWLTTGVAFSPEGRLLASANQDGSVRLWDVPTGQEMACSPWWHRGPATSVAFSPDGRRLASGSLDRTWKVWDTTTGEPLRAWGDPTGGVQSVAFSPDGQRLAWGSTDGTVKVCDLASLASDALRGHTGGVNSVAFSPDGRQIASASADGTVMVWEAPLLGKPPGPPAGGPDK